MVHFYRNVFSHVPATTVREVSHMLKAIHAQESREAADRRNSVVDQTLHEHAPTLSAGDRTRSLRCLIKCAKDSGHYHIAGTAWSTKRYMNMHPLYQQAIETGAAVA
jgi:transposase-like protein